MNLRDDKSLVLCANTFSRSLPDQALKDFQSIFQNKFGRPLSIEEARGMASSLLDLYRIVAEEGDD